MCALTQFVYDVCVAACMMLTGLEATGVCLRVSEGADMLSVYMCNGCHVGGFRFFMYVYRVCVTMLVCVFLTVFEDTNEQGFVGLTVPPVSWDLSVERLWYPDIQLTVAEINISHY